MGKETVTSVKVDEDLWKEAKIAAIKEGITLQRLLNEALEVRVDPKAFAVMQRYLKEKKE
ncbi:MAG: hypothetical protein JRN18_01170 [Nitrososphaerota archaeon]|jgi:predicted DNA binding CopG/RHH family protein|nr:hypothetical protein [Nitrososphaerota archaeon]